MSDGKSIENRIPWYANELLASSPEAAQRARRFFLEADDGLLDTCVQSRAMRRMEGISQLGLKRGTRGIPNVMIPFCDGREDEITAMRSVTRLEHSQRVCAAMVALCSLQRIPFEAMRHAAVGALFHDAGHPPFSHTVEPVLTRRHLPNHETVGQRIFAEDEEILCLLRDRGMNPWLVVSVMREEHDLGLLQRMVDTATYLVHDAESGGFPGMAASFLPELFGAIDAVRDGAYEISNLTPMVQFLSWRVILSNELYEHAYNRLNSLLLMELLDWLLCNQMESPEVLLRGTDRDMLSSLERALRSSVPAWVRSAEQFVRRDPREIVRWTVEEHGTEEAARDGGSDENRPRFVLSPIDCTRKTMPVRLSSDRILPMRVNQHFRATHHAAWYSVSYSGPI